MIFSGLGPEKCDVPFLPGKYSLTNVKCDLANILLYSLYIPRIVEPAVVQPPHAKRGDKTASGFCKCLSLPMRGWTRMVVSFIHFSVVS